MTWGTTIARDAARLAWLVVALACAPRARATDTTVASPGFVLPHAGAVDSGVLSVLGTFSTPQTRAAPTLRLPKFDPSVGHLDSVALTLQTTTSTFTVAPSGVLSLISFASASRAVGYMVTAGTTVATDGATRLDSGGLLLTLLGLGSADIGGAQLASTKSFAAPADVAGFVGAGTVAVDVAASDTLTVSTLLSLFNGAGFTGTGQVAGTVSLRYSYTPYAAGGQLSINKVASVATAASGDVITYTLVFTNNGNVPVNALAINDATPAYTTYRSSRSVAIPPGMAASGATAPSVGAAGGLSWTFSGALAAASSGSVEYSVRVD